MPPARGPAVEVLQWLPVPGRQLPTPVLADDSGQYDVRTVRDVRGWLDSVRPGFDARRPSSILINLHRPLGPGTLIQADVHYGISLDCTLAGECVTPMARFRTATIEVLCEKDPIKARYRFLVAIDDSDLDWPRCIVGPCLGILPGGVGQDVVIVPEVETVKVMACR